MIPQYLSPAFHLLEFSCHSGDSVPSASIPTLIFLVREVLQPIRDEWNAPLIVVSGYRTPEWNQRVGGATTSTHLFVDGAAGVDVRPVRLAEVAKLHAMILAKQMRGELPEMGGLGEYPNWSHVDSRKLPSGRLRRWKGMGMGSEPLG